MGEYQIALLPGDGIGPEVIREAVRVLEAVGSRCGHTFTQGTYLVGGAATDACGVPYPPETASGLKSADAILLGAVGGPKWDDFPVHLRPEKGLLQMRQDLGLYANLRPAALRPALQSACPLRAETAARGFDIMLVRELTGGIYFGKRDRFQTPDRGEVASDLLEYSELEIERIGRRAFELAMLRRKNLISVDKANVLESSRLWRSVMHRLSRAYPEVQYSDMYVDNAAMQLIRDPAAFDVIVTENMFGDILSDEASMITGSIGLLPSASMGETAPALYEPIHGSAPDIAGQDKANPVAAILSVAMMLQYSLGLPNEAQAIERAVDRVLEAGYRTADMAGGSEIVGTAKMGDMVAAYLA
ncbi:MAG: 3-isopropylmalate dehydrogenase [Oscillospiraceae bacterium]|nr:3-isopropylmalate dehydrogenase [Oscillospiraceae bacterium]